ncbi:hypothetical protein AB1Y20_020479 [Prymnesium parvum]|uniref:Major facilitator superfamily (MFS) profile domain-containing protein n=1 Tax=Prymnesium parvum TaxID=97485 RepID=A0AB34JXH0_PRYPA
MQPNARRAGCLLCATRAVVQACRMVWPPLVVLIAAEFSLSLVEQATLLSGFPLGYMCTQVVGGIAADRFGGKPVQTASLAAFALVMLCAATARSEQLYFLYLIAGLCAGPQEPAYSAMSAAWFAQHELGRLSAFADTATVAGELFATVGGPLLAEFVGWRVACALLGVATGAYTLLWAALAASKPQEGALKEKVKDARRVRTGVHERPAGTPPRQSLVARAALSLSALRHPALWACVVQHMAFNGVKYTFSAWMPTYYARKFDLSRAQSAKFLGIAQLVGLASQFGWARVERFILAARAGPAVNAQPSVASLLVSRRAFAAAGFLLMGCCAFGLSIVSTDWGTCLLLCGISSGASAHSFGFKANYLDLSSRHSGLYMGVGNTLATFMTLVMPLGAAYVLENNDWTMLFSIAAGMALIGLVAGTWCTSVERRAI